VGEENGRDEGGTMDMATLMERRKLQSRIDENSRSRREVSTKTLKKVWQLWASLAW
jgi:hypothetical protein